jgi:hypothetical protein
LSGSFFGQHHALTAKVCPVHAAPAFQRPIDFALFCCELGGDLLEWHDLESSRLLEARME